MTEFSIEEVSFISDALRWQEALSQFEYTDFYHLFDYVYLEALRINGAPKLIVVNTPSGLVGLSIILRKIPGERKYFDATAVYGYNGVLTSLALTPEDFHSGIAKIKKALVLRGCVSFFNRESNFTTYRLPEAVESGKILAVDLTQTPEAYQKSLAEGHRQEIKSLRKLNYTVIKSNDYQGIKDFHDIYEQTMLRRGAKTDYLFSINYFVSVLKIHSSGPDLRTVYHDGKMVAGAIFTTRGDHLYYQFSGSLIGITPYPAIKLIMDEVIRENLGKSGKRHLHLGGGLGGSEDSLYKFKYGFGKTVLPFYTTNWILIPDVYDRLSAQFDAAIPFFPRYRIA
jgi:hypothetical protein